MIVKCIEFYNTDVKSKIITGNVLLFTQLRLVFRFKYSRKLKGTPVPIKIAYIDFF